ncbi:rRNA-processing protein FYV7 [Mercurialis annua]|uniref:rRNA-processing protein FYV7 n=1 Tax=Mercurialis annua TaxID=3986 RepID=UPI00215F6131|nr:rRNA-processing protein FYV7 [Mercurialis annua]
MKNRSSINDEVNKNEKLKSSKSVNMKKKNMTRLGGRGLSLEVFANVKSTSSHHNPAIKKKQREFYKNAKCVNQYRKKIKQQIQPNDLSSAVRPREGTKETAEPSKTINKNKNKQKHGLRELYEKQREEKENARIEREAVFKAKKEEREKAEARRKAERVKMFKKTRHGQPVMKYRIEHLLQTIQGSN